ncbi:MgtC/SapB family protein [bacterium]|nr:MgtC/SapB family protein [bacterium]
MLDIHVELVTKISISVLCGTIFGIERQLRGKPVGIRTSILIVIGTCLFIHLSSQIEGIATDYSRVLGQVVTGIGFLGAGVILTKDGLVLGMTSAAVIWVLAAVGAAIGFEQYTSAIIITVCCVTVLVLTRFLEGRFKDLLRGVHEDEE